MENENTVNQENNTKTFTQDEVNKIVGERLAREKAQFADYEDLKVKAARLDEIESANKSELEKATDKIAALTTELEGMKKLNNVREIRERVSKATGVPVDLISAEDEATCTAQAEAIKAYATANVGYPQGIKDGGEVVPPTGGTTRDQFAAWMARNFD